LFFGWKGGDQVEWLKSVFSGGASLNAVGVVGILVMLAGAFLSVSAGRRRAEKFVKSKLIGLGVALLGTVVLIAYGKN